MKTSVRKTLFYVLPFIVAPAIVIGGALLFREKHYAWISFSLALLSVGLVFLSFERKNTSAKELAVISAMVALSAAGRFVFAFVPGFKPVTAITVIAAIWLGPEQGFLVGSLSALISNFYFGQGAWTPFQMLSWGVIGFIAGLMSRPLKKSKLALCAYGLFAGVLFSMMMDIWTVIWIDRYFNIPRYVAAIASALPVTAEYAVSNVIFLLVLSSPIGGTLERIKKKYGLFGAAEGISEQANR